MSLMTLSMGTINSNHRLWVSVYASLSCLKGILSSSHLHTPVEPKISTLQPEQEKTLEKTQLLLNDGAYERRLNRH